MAGVEKDGGHGGGVGTVTRSDGGNLSDSKRNPSEFNPPVNRTADADVSCSVAQSSTEAVPETEGDDSTSTRRPTLDVPSTAAATRGNSASLSSNSSALTSASSGRTQMKVIYYQNRFIAIPIPSAPNQRQPSDTDNRNDDVTSGSVNPLADGNADVIGAHFASQQPCHPHHHPHHHHNHPTSDRTGVSTQEAFQVDRKSYLMLRFIELLHDKDRQSKRTKTSKNRRSRATLALVKCLNLFFLAMGILLFVGVLIAIAFSSVMQWLSASHK